MVADRWAIQAQQDGKRLAGSAMALLAVNEQIDSERPIASLAAREGSVDPPLHIVPT